MSERDNIVLNTLVVKQRIPGVFNKRLGNQEFQFNELVMASMKLTNVRITNTFDMK